MQPQNNLFVFFGMIASGKSTLAEAWAKRNNIAYYNSDVLRKKLAGLSPAASQKESVDQGIYSPGFTAKTYLALLAAADQELQKDRGVVLDGSYQSRQEREKVRQLAKKHGVDVYFIMCVCPETIMKARMEKRALDPAAVSDGRWEIYLKQKERFEAPAELSPAELIVLTTDNTPENLLTDLEEKFARG